MSDSPGFTTDFATGPVATPDRSHARRLQPGEAVPLRRFDTATGATLDIVDAPLTHLQFRRFAGCPICSLHLQSFARRKDELAHSIREVVFFHSGKEDLARYAADLPFAVIPDPGKEIYRAFGVEVGARALVGLRPVLSVFRSVVIILVSVILGRRRMPPLRPAGGSLGLPADFLVDAEGRIVACKYGEHADDQWPVDDVLVLARRWYDGRDH